MIRPLCLFIVFGLLPLSVVTGLAADKTLPDTNPLTIAQPLDEFMVEGIDRFCLKALAASRHVREETWNGFDSGSRESWEKHVAPMREKFRELIGAVDPRLTAGSLRSRLGFETGEGRSRVGLDVAVLAHRVVLLLPPAFGWRERVWVAVVRAGA